MLTSQEATIVEAVLAHFDWHPSDLHMFLNPSRKIALLVCLIFLDAVV
jgi:hypothetical protein